MYLSQRSLATKGERFMGMWRSSLMEEAGRIETKVFGEAKYRNVSGSERLQKEGATTREYLRG